MNAATAVTTRERVDLPASRLLPGDILRVGSIGLRTRRLRAALSALGISIGIATVVAVLGVSESSRAGLLAEIDRLGTNLLTVTAGQSFTGSDSVLPEGSAAATGHLDDVEGASAVTTLSDQTIRRSPYIDSDVVFGVRPSLVVDFEAHPPGKAPDGRVIAQSYWSAHYDFHLQPEVA